MISRIMESDDIKKDARLTAPLADYESVKVPAGGGRKDKPFRRWEYGATLQNLGWPNFSGQRFLDVGCGGSWLTTFLGMRSAMTVGVDYGKKMEKQKQRAKDRRAKDRSSLQVVNANGIHLPFPNDTFNGVASVSVLEHVATWDQFDFLTEMVRVLKQGGRFALTFDLGISALTKADAVAVRSHIGRLGVECPLWENLPESTPFSTRFACLGGVKSGRN